MGLTTTNTSINAARLWDDIMALAEITDPAAPYTRRSFTPLFLAGRDWLRAQFEAAGLSVRIDSAGNLIGRREGTDPSAGTIMIGSHSDTVPGGGRFDGIAGVIAGLEIARGLAERGITLRNAIEIVDFLAEEPSEFGLSCVGSRGMSGRLEPAMLEYRGPEAETLGSALTRVGGDPERLREAKRDDIVAFFELHIEQGRILETSRTDLGIVTGIVGISRIEIVFLGRADHAGTTPMDLRNDALAAAAQTIVAVRSKAETLAKSGRGYFVATTGVISSEPNAANIVPRTARIVIDARSEDRQMMDAFVREIDAESLAFAAQAAVQRERFTLLSDSPPVACDERLRTALAACAGSLGLSVRDLASGAGHDAAFIATVAPVAMVFVPSRDGRSHCAEEWTDRDYIAAGAAAILEAVIQIDRRPTWTERTSPRP